MNNTYITNTTAIPNSVLVAGSNGTSWGSVGAVGSTGSNGPSWITTNTSSTPSTLRVADGVMTVIGDPASLEVKGKVVINGLDLEERLKIIEKVLMIPERDAIMEDKYPSLKKKFDEYINALEKYKTFERIKGTYDK
jgi:hypothetical protein